MPDYPPLISPPDESSTEAAQPGAEPGVERARLSQLTDSRKQTTVSVRYTRMVRTLRLVLPILALAIVAVVAAWPSMDQIKPTPVNPATKKTGGNELIKPHFQGQDDKNQPYVVTADRAVQSAGNSDMMLLEQPRGHSTLNDGTSVDAGSVKGTYYQKAQHLFLEGDVRLGNSQGYVMHGTRVFVDIAGHTASSDQPVHGEGPDGTLAATGLQADNNTGVLVFTGPATLVITNGGKGL